MNTRDKEIVSLQQIAGHWKTNVVFCRDEIKVLNRYLQEVSGKNRGGTIDQELNDFKGKLAEKIAFANELMGDVKVYEEQLNDHRLPLSIINEMHAHIRERVNNYCKSYTDLKSVFIKFLAKADIVM